MPINGYFDVVFGQDGDLTAVPDGVQGDGSVSYDQGYGPDYELDPTSNPDALLIERRKFNQLLFDVTTAVQNWQQHSIAPFITPTMNGGTAFSYSKNDLVRYDPGSGIALYQSLINANTDLPTVTASWELLNLSGNGIPANTQVGASYAPVTTDIGKLILRSNSGSAMTDTLPGTSGALAAGWFAYLQNIDTTSNDTVHVGSGGSIRVGSNTGSNSFAMQPGEAWIVVSLGSGAYTAFLLSTSTRPLTTGNNLSDLASLATSLTNLGFASDSASYFQIPNPNNPALPWLIQFGTGVGESAVTFPVTFPNAIIAIFGTLRQAVPGPLFTMFNAASLTTSGFTAQQYLNGGGATTDPNFWLAIGN